MSEKNLCVDTLASYQRHEAWRSDVAHSLQNPVLFWITRGQGRMMIDCRMRGVCVNTALFIPAHTLFSYEMFSGTHGMVVSLPRDRSFNLPASPALIKASSVQAQTELTVLIDVLARELAQDQIGRDCAIRAHVMLISVWLERQLSRQPKDPLGKSDQVLRKFSKVVSIGHRDGKTVGDFASDLKVSATHLTRLTQGAIGKPASALVQERVIHAACDALIHSDTSIQTIADDLGFSSAAYFTRAFQANVGQSPSAFRKARRGCQTAEVS